MLVIFTACLMVVLPVVVLFDNIDYYKTELFNPDLVLIERELACNYIWFYTTLAFGMICFFGYIMTKTFLSKKVKIIGNLGFLVLFLVMVTTVSQSLYATVDKSLYGINETFVGDVGPSLMRPVELEMGGCQPINPNLLFINQTMKRMVGGKLFSIFFFS